MWWSGSSTEFPSFQGEIDVEVVVIGGGIAGITLAATLIEQGTSVALFDARDLASGASGRNAGFLTVAPAEPYTESIALWGRSGARTMLEIGRRSHQRIRQWVKTLPIDCDYRVSGSLRLARTDEEAADFRASLPLLKADGFPMEEISVEDAIPSAVGRWVA